MALVVGALGTATPRTAAQVYSFNAQINVGASSAPVAVTVSIKTAGKVAGIRVVGQGTTGVDFASANSGTCTAGVAYPAGQSCTVGVSFSPAYPGVRNGAVVLTAADGSVLGTEFLSGVGVGALGTFVPGTISTLAGQPDWIYNGDGQPANGAAIFLPFGIAVDSVGNVYIADQGNNRIRKVTASTGLISTVAGIGSLGAAGDGGLATSAQVSGPSSVALDGAGNLYISDTGNNVVREIVASTGIIRTIAGTLGVTGYSGDGGSATSATLNSPQGIALDSSGNLYIADTANSVIRRVDAGTGVITTIAGTGTAGYSGDGGPATSAKLHTPWSVTPAPGGVLYIADQGNNRVRMVSANGIVSTLSGNGDKTFTGDGGPASQATLDSPANVAVDVAGNIYIADSGNNRVRKISSGTNQIDTIAGGNGQSASGDGGPANAAGLYGPYTLALDGFGNLYIADVFHNRVREVTANAATLDYQPMRVGTIAAAQPQTIENDGNATLNIATLQTVSNSLLDGPTTTCAIGQALTPLASCVIGASFAPVTLGSPVIGTISLGSNAINSADQLTLSGNVLSENPTTVTVAASANPITVGDSVYFTVGVTASGTTPTGNVSLLDGTAVIGTATLANGVATIAEPNLAGGSHSITASYVGDGTNLAGVSTPLVEIVKFIQAPTQTTATANPNPAIAGSPVTLTATVALTTSGSGNGTLSGSVTFNDGATIVGAGSVSSNGIATLTTSTLGVGPHSIVASYSGASSFAASASTALPLTVQAGVTTTLLASSANPTYAGGKLTLTATVASNGATPTGTLSFLDGATSLGTATLSKTGIATLAVTGLAIGNHSLTAVYGGDTMNGGSTSSALLETVSIATTTAVVTSSLNPAPQGSSVTLTAAVAGNGGIPTGTVQFLDGTAILGTGTLHANGTTTLTTATLGIGAHTITVNYLGDTLDAPSTSAALTQTVIAATSIVAFTSSANPSPAGGTLNFNVQVTGTGPQPTGTVTLEDGTTVMGTQPLNSGGLATFSGANLAIGVHNLVALYSGDADHAQNTAALAERIVQVTTTSVASSAMTGIAGTNVTLTATVIGLSNQPLTGTVTFKDGGTTLATSAVDAAGHATYSSAALAIGAHTISASYSGDNLDQASASTPLVETIQIATTKTTLASSANPAFAGANLTLTATVTGDGAAPAGSILITDGATTLGTLPVPASGVVTLTTSTLTPGIHTLLATYSGDSNDATSASPAISQSIVQQTTLTATSSANPSMFQDNVTITVTVSGGVAAYPPTGNVTLSDGAAVVGTAAVNAIGTATFTLTAPALGQHVLSASYSGDTHNSPATSQNLTQSVILRPTTNQFTASASYLSSGSQVTFISLVQGVGPKFPTGTITFVSGSTTLGTAVLDANGLATLTFTPPQGSYNVVAQYPGDTLFAASNSSVAPVVVGPTVAFTMTATPATVSMASGDHTTLTIQIVTAPTFSDTLAIGCAGLPADATCTFSTNSIKVPGGSATSLTMVLDTGTPLGAGPTASVAPAKSGTEPEIALACILPGGMLFCLLFFRARRFRKQLTALAMLLLLATAGMLSGCGSSLHIDDTPAGQYTIQLIGSGATTGVTQTGTISLTVN